MQQKTLFITGTNSGFGKATVELFAQQGWSVAATVRNTDDHPDLFKELETVKLYSLDVTDYAQVEAVAAEAIRDFGKIDVLANNAGYCLMGPTETATMEQIEAQFKTNTFGVFAVTKAFIGHMRENKGGTIINIVPSSGLFNNPFIGAYGASKGAVRSLTEGLGIELSPFGIEVKGIYPGTHATKVFTKLDQSDDSNKAAYEAYLPFYKNFLGATSSVFAVTSPKNVANEILKAATVENGALHIATGGDVKFSNASRGFCQTALG